MKKEIINTNNAPQPIGPYNQAIKIGGFLFVSGQIALSPQTNLLVQTSIEDETNQVMGNLGAILKECGLNFSNIIKSSIFLKNMDDFTVVNEVYGSYFEKDFPVRETVEVSKLPKNVNVEISCIASLD